MGDARRPWYDANDLAFVAHMERQGAGLPPVLESDDWDVLKERITVSGAAIGEKLPVLARLLYST